METSRLLTVLAVACSGAWGLPLVDEWRSAPEVHCSDDVDPCKCTVVNTVSTAIASGTCNQPGVGTVPCISVALPPTFPEGLPADGRCNHPTCQGANACTYAEFRVSITIASCASACSLADSVAWRMTHPAGSGSANSQAINSSAEYRFEPGNIPSTCGTPEWEVVLKFQKADGTTAAMFLGRYGCGSCSAPPN